MKGIVTAIEFGSSKVACLTGVKRPFGRFELLYATHCPYAGFRKKSWLQGDAVGYAVSEAIRKTLGELDRKIDSVYVGIPGEFTSVIQTVSEMEVQTGKVTENDMDTLKHTVSMQEKPDHTASLKSYAAFYRLDGNEPVKHPLGIKASRLSCEYINIYADKAFIQDTKDICSTIGVAIDGCVCVPEAMAKMVALDQSADFEIIVDAGYYVTDITITYGTKPVFHRTLEVGGYHLANDIGLCLDIPLEEAESLKRKMTVDTSLKVLPSIDEKPLDYENRPKTTATGGSAYDIMMARLDEICTLIGQALKQSGMPLKRDTRLHLTGGGVSMIEGIERYFHQRLDRPVRIVDTGMKKADAACYTGALATLFHAFMLEDKGTKS